MKNGSVWMVILSLAVAAASFAQTFTISGTVTDWDSNLKIKGVPIQFSHDNSTVHTDASGNYTKTVDSGESTKVFASCVGCLFRPQYVLLTNIISDQPGINFTAACSTVTVSGRVTRGGAALPGVTITFTQFDTSVTTDANGDYYWTENFFHATFDVIPSLPGYTFSPAQATITYLDNSNHTFIRDFSATPLTYTISGKVEDDSYHPIQWVTVHFSHNGSSTQTDRDGNYSYPVPGGTTTTIYCTKSGYIWRPGSRTLSNITSDQPNQNFSGALGTYPVSGTVTAGGTPLGGALITFSHNNATTTTSSSGYYSYGVAASTTTTITPSLAGIISWEPPSRTLTNITGFQSGQNFSGTPGIYFLSGVVSDGVHPLSGVTLTFSHDAGTITTGPDGTFSRTVNGRTTTTITPSRYDLVFTPASRTLTTIVADQPEQNFTGQPATYTISGRISCGAEPIPGATVTFSHNSATATTDASGQYSYIIPYGTTTTLTPSHPGYHGWSPATRLLNSISADQPDQDFSGTLNVYKISGIVSDGVNPVANATVTFSPQGWTRTSDALGHYDCDVNHGTTTTLTPSHPGYHGWSPATRLLNSISADQPDQDFQGTINTYAISGLVMDERGPVPGATVTFSHDHQVLTAGDAGLFTYLVPYHTTTTLTPAHPAYSRWVPASITLTDVSSDQPDQTFVAQLSAFVVALGFQDTTGAALGGVLCRLQIPGLQEWKVESAATMQLLWGVYPHNALFRSADAQPGGDYVFRFTAPAGWEFVDADSLVLQVPAGENYYATRGHLYVLRKAENVPAPGDSGTVMPAPSPDTHPLVFVSGSPCWPDEPWNNAVDEDLEGWDGTATVRADESGAAWAIFAFSDNTAHQFNYFFVQTDNGAADDLLAARQINNVQILYSADGMEAGDFTSLGSYRIESPEMTFYKIGRDVTAKTVMLRLVTPPGTRDGWQQIVEFGLSWNKMGGARPASTEREIKALPGIFELEPGYPNPFNPEVTIRYRLHEETHVLLSIYNLSGQEVARLADGEEAAGAHARRWNGAGLPSGIYLVRLTAAGHTAMQRIALVK